MSQDMFGYITRSDMPRILGAMDLQKVPEKRQKLFKCYGFRKGPSAQVEVRPNACLRFPLSDSESFGGYSDRFRW
jgi:hypothetical protein